MDCVQTIDWQEEFSENSDKWVNHGRNVLRNSCKHKNGVDENDYCEKCDISEDDCEPMMNYGYPLAFLPTDEQILKVVKNTCLTVMENEDSGDIFLVLCGGGMNLSQSIGIAYLYCEQHIPDDLIFEISTQPCLSVGRTEYFKLMRYLRKQLKFISRNARAKEKEIKETAKAYKTKLLENSKK